MPQPYEDKRPLVDHSTLCSLLLTTEPYMLSYVLTYTHIPYTHIWCMHKLKQGDDSDNDGGVVDLLDGAMVRHLKLVGGSDDEDSDLEGEEVELQVGEDGKLIVPGKCTLTHFKLSSYIPRTQQFNCSYVGTHLVAV
jgi:hypothetical protein